MDFTEYNCLVNFFDMIEKNPFVVLPLGAMFIWYFDRLLCLSSQAWISLCLTSLTETCRHIKTPSRHCSLTSVAVPAVHPRDTSCPSTMAPESVRNTTSTVAARGKNSSKKWNSFPRHSLCIDIMSFNHLKAEASRSLRWFIHDPALKYKYKGLSYQNEDLTFEHVLCFHSGEVLSGE